MVLAPTTVSQILSRGIPNANYSDLRVYRPTSNRKCAYERGIMDEDDKPECSRAGACLRACEGFHALRKRSKSAVNGTRVPLVNAQAPAHRVRPRLASLDITGTLLAVGALGAGARVRAIVAFGRSSILGTVAFGTILLLIVGPRIAGIDWGMLLPHDPTEDRVAAFVEIVL
jgi:hypothetical protein